MPHLAHAGPRTRPHITNGGSWKTVRSQLNYTYSLRSLAGSHHLSPLGGCWALFSEQTLHLLHTRARRRNTYTILFSDVLLLRPDSYGGTGYAGTFAYLPVYRLASALWNHTTVLERLPTRTYAWVWFVHTATTYLPFSTTGYALNTHRPSTATILFLPFLPFDDIQYRPSVFSPRWVLIYSVLLRLGEKLGTWAEKLLWVWISNNLR